MVPGSGIVECITDMTSEGVPSKAASKDCIVRSLEDAEVFDAESEPCFRGREGKLALESAKGFRVSMLRFDDAAPEERVRTLSLPIR